MKAFLLYRERDFDPQQQLPPQAAALIQDLELNTLFNTMALGDKFVFEVVTKAVLFSVTDLDTIHYRQHVLQDCLKNASIVRDIYAIAVEAIEGEKKNYLGMLSRYAEKPPTYGFTIDDRDESGARALSDLKDRGINQVANALGQSTDHVLSFFTMLRTELAFYLGCVNLHAHLAQLGEPKNERYRGPYNVEWHGAV